MLYFLKFCKIESLSDMIKFLTVPFAWSASFCWASWSLWCLIRLISSSSRFFSVFISRRFRSISASYAFWASAALWRACSSKILAWRSCSSIRFRSASCLKKPYFTNSGLFYFELFSKVSLWSFSFRFSKTWGTLSAVVFEVIHKRFFATDRKMNNLVNWRDGFFDFDLCLEIFSDI